MVSGWWIDPPGLKIRRLSPHIIPHTDGAGDFYGVVGGKARLGACDNNGEHGAFYLKRHR